MRQRKQISAVLAILFFLVGWLAGCGSSTKVGGALPPANSANSSGGAAVQHAFAVGHQLPGAPVSVSITPQRPSRPNPLPSVPAASATTIVVDVLLDRHPISPLIYGVNFPPSTSYVTDSGATLVRWGGNASTRYNWKNFDTNAANDWYFQNREMDDSNPLYQDSTYFVSSIAKAGAVPIMTIGMLPWVAKDDSSYSFSVKTYGAQCGVNPYASDDGDGVVYSSACSSDPVYVTGNYATDAHVPLLDSPGTGDPAGSIYRSQWVAAVAPNYGSQPHWYDMDNEMDIWTGTHRDVHPANVSYDEMRDTFLTEARAVKTWDPSAIRLGPVSCCWWFYWNTEAGADDKTAHGGVDLLPWWLNEIYWADEVAGTRSLDVLDIHAYPEAGTSSDPPAKIALRVTRDFWDPTYVAEPGTSINQNWATFTQPNKTIPFRIPRLRAILNSTYPNTPLSFTEWNAAFAGESDFSTALVDADAYGIMGRERLYAATRWEAADASTAAYQALKLYRNYDGQHHTFGSISLAVEQSADPDLFSSYAAIDTTGTTVTVMLINKDPSNTVTKTVAISGFNPSEVTAYTLSQSSPTAIVAGTPQAWTGNYTLAPYTATLLVISGSTVNPQNIEWDLNPDVLQIPASGTATLQPRITSSSSASGSITFSQVTFDLGITMTLTQPQVTTTQNGTITVTAGATPGFYHFAATAIDNYGVTQTQEGWVLVGNPAATLIKTGDGQSATRGTTINLSVQLNVGSSGGDATGASVLFTTDQGTLSAREVQTNSSGVASVQLTLPNAAATVHVTAEGPIGLGHPVVTFTETSQ